MVGHLAGPWNPEVRAAVCVLPREIQPQLTLTASSAIFFDGSLPQHKRPERLSRIRQHSVIANNYFLATSAGIPKEDNSGLPFARLPAVNENRPLPILSTRKKNFALPCPSFLVPAILDTLRSSRQYGPLIRLVSGEADPYLAQAVKRDGGTILTSDSDLLLYDLGPDGNVVFLNDISISAPAEIRQISAPVYNQLSILRKMSPTACLLDLQTFAYDLTKDSSWSSLAEWMAQAETASHRAGHEDDVCRQFITQYEDFPAIVSSQPGGMEFLDPRIAEFIISGGNHRLLNNNPSLDGSLQRVPEFFLPQLLDRWDLGSAWHTGRHIRELAYSICYPGSTDDQSSIIEYRRTLSENPQGHEMSLSSGEQTAQYFRDTLASINTFIGQSNPSSRQLEWIALCLSLELSDTASESKQSVAVKSWENAAQPKPQRNLMDWDTVHLAANVQGTLYSLRILYQLLKGWQAGLLPGPECLKEMDVEAIMSCLSSLPDLTAYPRINDMAGLFQKLVDCGMAAIIERVSGVALPYAAILPPRQGKMREKQLRPKTTRREKAARRRSANPFDILDLY